MEENQTINGKTLYGDVLCLNKRGEVLLVRRASDDESNAGKWCLAGGHLDKGETAVAGALREFREETNIVLEHTDVTLLEKKVDENAIVYVYLYCAPPEIQPTIDAIEHHHFEWMSKEQLETGNYDLVFDLKERLCDYLIDMAAEIADKKGFFSDVGVYVSDKVEDAFLTIKKAFDEGLIDEDTFLESLKFFEGKTEKSMESNINEFPIDEIDAAYPLSDIQEMSVEESFSVIEKAFNDGLVSEDVYLEALEKAFGHKYIRRLWKNGRWHYFYDKNIAKKGGKTKKKLENDLENHTFTYKESDYLTDPKHREIENKFGKYLQNNFKEAFEEYQRRFKNVLNTDDVRELSPDYNENRGELSAAVHEPASAFTKEMYKILLDKPIEYGQVFFTGGGTGAGKSSGINNVGSLARTQAKSDIVYDTNMNKFDSSVKKIEQALDSGRKVTVAYVVRDPIESFLYGMIPRMHRIGRSVPISAHVETHIGAIQTAKAIKERYSGNDSVTMRLVDNTLGKNNAKEENFDAINKIGNFDKEKLTEELIQITQKLYSDGQITESQYRGIIGTQEVDTSTNIGTSTRGGESIHKGLNSKGVRGFRNGRLRGEHKSELFESIETLSKAFDSGQITEDQYLEAVSNYTNLEKSADTLINAYIEGSIDEDTFEKAKKDISKLIKKEVLVTRAGKTFKQTVYVKGEEEVETPVGGELTPTVKGLEIEKYSAKSILIKGDTYANVELMRKIKKETGFGAWNSKLKGWIFGLNSLDKVLGLIWSDVVDKDETKAEAIKNQKNESLEKGDSVNVGYQKGTVLGSASDSEGIKYNIKLEDGNTLFGVSEGAISKAAETNDKKISETVNNAVPENRAKTEKKIFGIKAVEDIHKYSLEEYMGMHGITPEEISAAIAKMNSKGGERKPTPSGGTTATRERTDQKELSKQQLISKLIYNHYQAVKNAVIEGKDIPESALAHYDDLKEQYAKGKKELSEEHKRKISEALKKDSMPELDEYRSKLDTLVAQKEELEKEMYALYDKGRGDDVSSPDKLRFSALAREKRSQAQNLSKPIHNLKNKVAALENGGSLFDFTDKVGQVYENLPDFTKVDTTDISYDEDTILNEPRPPYIPQIDEDAFESGGFILDMVKVDDDRYIVATDKHKEKSEIKDGFSYKTGDFDPEQGGYVALTLDQLVLTQDYYMSKQKVKNIKDAEAKNQRQIDHWNNLPDSSKERYMNQKNLYHSLPAKTKKKYTKDQWESMGWQDREKIYKPVKRYGVKRLKNVFDSSHMANSFHSMYERFIDPSAKRKDRSGNDVNRGERGGRQTFAHPDVFPKWVEFREMIEWKSNDIKVQREEIRSETREKALETSYGMANTNDTLRDEFGVYVKRQNGDDIRPIEVDQLKNAWVEVQNSFGNLKDAATSDNLKLSHAGETYMFASKAIGVYYPSFKAIGVTAKLGGDQLGFTMGHEIAHWIDNTLGKKEGKRFASNNYDSTAGKIAIAMRRGMNKKSNSKYLNSIHECFARALEQYHAVETMSGDAIRAGKEHYFQSDAYVGEKVYSEQLKPLIQQFLQENKDLLKSLGIDFEKARQYQIGETSTTTGLKKVAPGKWVDPKTGKPAKGEDEPKGKGKSKEESKDVDQMSEEELAQHARKTDTASLTQAAEGSNEKLRIEAKKELARREKEENFGEEEDSGGTSEGTKPEGGGTDGQSSNSKDNNDSEGSKLIRGNLTDSDKEDIETFVDIISMNPNSPSYKKYKDILNERYGVDYDKEYGGVDEEMIKNADLGDIKSKGDFLNFENWLTYANEISKKRGFIPMDKYILPNSEVQDSVWSDLSKDLGFDIEKKDYIDTGSSGDVAHTVGNTLVYTDAADMYYLFHELGHIYDFNNEVEGVSKNPAYSPTNYGTTYSAEAFAENFAIYFIAPDELKKLLPEVYVDIDSKIDKKWKQKLSGVMGKVLTSKPTNK